jgi:hypothetical protein
MGELGIHQRAQILTNGFFYIGANHYKKLFGLLLDLFEKVKRLWYTDFKFHWRFSSFSWFVVKPL